MTEPPQPAPTTEDRPPLWRLDRGEQRLLFVTFVGGAASFVVGAAIVGTAIAVGRAFANASKHTAAVNHAVEIFLASLGVLVAAGVGARFVTHHANNYRKYRPAVDRAVLGVGFIMAGAAALLGIIVVLAVIGIAAGVH
jgi:hypothetical protein